MIVFDVDGTLIGGEATDWASFGAAFQEVAGFALEEPFFASIEEVTAQAIVHQALEGFSPMEKKEMEHAVCQGYLRRLREAHADHPSSFPAIGGALVLLQELQERGIPIAIATGDWQETISFKLQAAGIPVEGIPMMTSSDFYSRADIISAAVTKAGRTLEEAVYVGDGLWDLRACRRLGIPFIGVGSRRDKLREAGAIHILQDFDVSEFFRIRDTILG
jgi:phosphoglycolate phosphatase-like HAD superfamily hydrolase